MAKENKLFELLMTDDDTITDEDTAALTAEAAGQAPAPKAPEAPAPEAPPEDAPAEPQADDTPADAPAADEPAEPAEPPADAKPKKKLTGANARIAELVEERNRAREEAAARAAEVAAEREKWARLEERQKAIRELEAQQRHAEEAAQAAAIAAQHRAAQRPDPALDPQGAELFDLKERIARQEEEMRQAVAAAQQGFQQMQAQQATNQFTAAWRADLAAFQAQNPDYPEAAKYATEQRIKFWENLGIPRDGEMGAADRAAREALAIAAEALNNGRSPSALFYDLAKTWGYQKPEPAGAPVRNATVPAQTTITPKEKLEQIQRGQKLQGLGGDTTNVAGQDDTDIESMTPEQFAKMPEEQYLAIRANPALRARMERQIQRWELN